MLHSNKGVNVLHTNKGVNVLHTNKGVNVLHTNKGVNVLHTNKGVNVPVEGHSLHRNESRLSVDINIYSFNISFSSE